MLWVCGYGVSEKCYGSVVMGYQKHVMGLWLWGIGKILWVCGFEVSEKCYGISENKTQKIRIVNNNCQQNSSSHTLA